MAEQNSGFLTRRRSWAFLYALALLVIVAAGFSYYHLEASRIRQEKAAELHAIGSLKISEITRWQEERIADIRILSGSRLFRDAVSQWPGSAELRGGLQQQLRLVCEAGRYANVFLIDTEGDVLISGRPAPDNLDIIAKQLVRKAAAGKDPVFGELHRAQDGMAFLNLAAAVRNDQDQPVAVVVLAIDPNDFLYPMIQSWPTPSHTAETLLVRRDGDSVLFLNDLRHLKDTALVLRVPLSDTSLPAVQAVLGKTGLFVGKDYREVEVLGDLAPVPGTPWFLVTKVDTSEIMAELHYRAIVALILAVVLSLTVAALAAYMYRSRQAAERQQIAEVLRTSAASLADAQRIAHTGSWQWNLENDTADWSEETFRIYGISPRTLTGHRASSLEWIHPDDRERVKQARADAMNGTSPYDFTFRILQPDGTEKTAHVLAEVVRNANGKPVLVRGTVQDITERQRLEDALLQRNAELLRFTYTVSHDLKSPLVTIRTFLGYLEQDLQKQDQGGIESDLGHMRRAAEKMSLLLDELLELSRVGRKMNPPEDISLQTLVAEAMDLVAGRITQRGVKVQVTDLPVTLHGDRVRLREVFQNLIDNAVKFMGEQPEPRVEIGAENTASETVLFVRDNGLGIDPRHQGKLFGLFEKLHPGTEGTGIGLALIKRIIEVHGGRIWAESAGPEQGSTFRFTLGKLKQPRGD
jgi:PAS domain S-box-containing protein